MTGDRGSRSVGAGTGSLAQRFRARARSHPDQLALRYKRYGVWHDVTWSEQRRRVEHLTLGLVDLGVTRGDRVAVLGDPSPDWLVADLGTQAAGGVVVAAHETEPPERLRDLLARTRPAVLVAGGQEHVDRLHEAEAGSPLVAHVVVVDPQGTERYDDPRLVALDALARRGGEQAAARPGAWDELVDATSPDDVVRIVETAGTTGAPRPVPLTSENLVAAWGGAFGSLPEPPGPRDRTVTHLSLAHLPEVGCSLVLPLLYGVVPHVPEDTERVLEAFIEVSPTVLVGYPRMWEAVAARAVIDIETGARTKRAAYRWAMRRAAAPLERAWAGRPVPAWQRAAAGLAHLLVFRPLLGKFGWQAVRLALVGGAPTSPDVVRLWQTWGVPLREYYGLAESAGVALVQTEAVPAPGGGARPVPGLEAHLAEDGEVELVGTPVFSAYWEGPPAAGPGGRFRTGDLARAGEGGTRVLDRKANLIATDAGPVPRAALELALKADAYIREAVVVGRGDGPLCALVEIDFDTVSEWARRNRVAYTSYASLATNPAVVELVGRSVTAANDRLAADGHTPIAEFRVLPRELDDQVTPTRTVRRHQVEADFGDLVGAAAPSAAPAPALEATAGKE